MTPASTALETFLTSLIRQEMSQMPRGVYHLALRGANLRSDQGKTVAGVPGFMLKTYEKNKQPGLKLGLAGMHAGTYSDISAVKLTLINDHVRRNDLFVSAGLLLCYDLPVQTDRDGRPITRFMVSRGRSFQQMLTTLIHEVKHVLLY